MVFLAARGEVYGALAVTFLFGGADIIVAAKVVFLVIWMGAATSKLNRHFPFVMSTMMSNSPAGAAALAQAAVLREVPRRSAARKTVAAGRATSHRRRDVRAPSAVLRHGGWSTAVAAAVMVCFHLGILTAIPMGVPLEWNVFMIFGVLTLFVGTCPPRAGDLRQPVPVGMLFVVIAGIVVRATCSRARSRSCQACGTTPATGIPHCGASSPRRTRRSAKASSRSPACRRPSWSGSTAAGAGADPDLPRICVPRHEHSRSGAVHPGAPGDGRRGARTSTTSPTVNASAAPPSAGISATATCTTSS